MFTRSILGWSKQLLKVEGAAVRRDPAKSPSIWARCVSNGLLGAEGPIFENLRAQMAI